MNTINIFLSVGLGIIIYAAGYIIGFQSCRDKALEVLIDRLLEVLEEEDDK